MDRFFKVLHAPSCTASASAPQPCIAPNTRIIDSTTPLPTIGTCIGNTNHSIRKRAHSKAHS
jgi:hypothetical protein